MTDRYRITEYDEDHRGHPSFLAEAIEPSPLAPAVILVRRPGGTWDAYRWDGSPWPAGHLTPGDARIVAARKYRELDESGFYDVPPRAAAAAPPDRNEHLNELRQEH
jgi:hypothetical protein